MKMKNKGGRGKTYYTTDNYVVPTRRKKKGGEEGMMVFLDKTELMVLNSSFLPLKERMIWRPTWSGR